MMNLAIWEPVRELEGMSNRLNRICGRPPATSDAAHLPLSSPDWAPSVDISASDKDYVIKANFKEGILTLTLPKSEKAKPRALGIKIS